MNGGAGERAGQGLGDGQVGESERDRAVSSLPRVVRGRFPGYAESELLAPAHRDFLVARLMEEGDGGELRWLVRSLGKGALTSLLASRGGRALSRRSRGFWERVLGVHSAPPHPLAHELWPLA